MADFRIYFRQLLESTFISAKGSRIDIYNGMISFLNKVIPIIPERLFRYRNINEHTLGAFENGTISVCKAKCFSDKYDSLIYVDVENELVKCRDASILALRQVLIDIKNKNPQIRTDRASRICYFIEQGMSDEEIIDRLFKEQIGKDLIEQSKELKHTESRFRDSEKTARIGCFTESVQSKFMWDTYAGGYSGFALEYNLKELFIKSYNDSIPTYVFPVIYTDERPDLTADEANYYVFTKLDEKGKLNMLEPLRPLLDLNLLSPHKPYLYKDKEEYGHEREWRLLHYEKVNTDDYMEISDLGCMKAIYYGPDIKEDDYEKLHQIASRKGIAEYKVSIDENSRKYSLKIDLLEQ
jgi:hypothetical protein